MKKVFLVIAILIFVSPLAYAEPPRNTRSKFYDFNEQVIDGAIRKPSVLYSNAKQHARFKRLLRLKKSFLLNLFETSKEKVFK